MKKLRIFFIVSLLVGSGSACENSLVETPRSFINPDAFFGTPASYETAVKGIYSSMDGYIGSNAMSMRELFSDVYSAPSASIEQALPTYQNNHQPFFYNVRGEWSGNYSLIKNANFVLERLVASSLPDQQKNPLMGETRFLRGYAYFQLVQFFGDVPLRTAPITDYGNVQIQRSAQADVYKQILEDLTFAESNLPAEASQKGRVYRSVATALLARVYLTMAGRPLNQTAYYQNALDKALAVINSGKFTLQANYSAVFQHVGYTSESIWEKQYVPGMGGNQLHQMTSTANGYNTLLKPATWLMNSFAPGDQRKAWGINSTYVDPDGRKLEPFFQKFVKNALIDSKTTQSAAAGQVDFSFPFVRLAEMYLIAAEAQNEISGPQNAYQYLNTIRERARINKADPTHVPALTGLSKDQFREAVLMERKWELHLEGMSWFDLKRTGNLGRIQTVLGAQLTHPIGTYNETWYLPDNEIINNNIPQNPLYQ